MSLTWSFRALPPGVREEAEARAKIVRGVLTELRTVVMPRHHPMDIDVWENTQGRRIAGIVAKAQADNAALVDRTMNMQLIANGWQDTPIGLIRPEGFAGRMPDGDPVEMIHRAVAKHVREKLALFENPTPQQRFRAWESGGKLLATMTQTALIDTQRMAKQVAGVMRPRTLYVRVANTPCCARCAVLAGKRGYWDKPFKRHPGCDCGQIAIPEGQDVRFEGAGFSPEEFWDSLTAEQQDRIFTKAGAQAIRDGADIAQVVNSRSGMSDAGSAFTNTSSRWQRVHRHDRLSVPEIIRSTEGDRDERVRLLFKHGYVRPNTGENILGTAEKQKLLAEHRKSAEKDRQKNLKSDFAQVAGEIEVTIPAEHILLVKSVKTTKQNTIVVRGGHSFSCIDEVVTRVATERLKHPGAVLQNIKTFFPDAAENELIEWLEKIVPEVLGVPEQVEKTRHGWRLQKHVEYLNGDHFILEVVTGPAQKTENFKQKIVTIYPLRSGNIPYVDRNGNLH